MKNSRKKTKYSLLAKKYKKRFTKALRRMRVLRNNYVGG